MILNVPLFGQRDPRWANKPLGTSSSTLGGYGCLVTVLAMLLKYYGKDTDPDRLNTALKNLDPSGFLNGNLYKWYEGITRLYSDIKVTKLQNTPDPLTSTDFNAFKAEIDAGRPVVLEVDFIPATAKVDMHFVLLVGYEGDTFYVNDPWYGDKANLNRYGDPKITIQRYVFHSGPIPAPGDSDMMQIKKSDFVNLVTKATALDNQNPSYAQLQQIIKEMNSQLDGEKAQNKSMTEFMKQLATLLGVPASQEEILGDITATLTKEQDYDNTKKENESLKEQAKDLQTQVDTKEQERKDAVAQLLPLSSENATLKDQIKDLTANRDMWEAEYNKVVNLIGSPGQFTKSELFSYLIKNWFNKNAFKKEV